MAELSWHYPENLNVARMLLQQPGTAPHGGGTALLKRDLSRINGLVNLSGLSLSDIRVSPDRIHLGATATYADVVRTLRPHDPEHVLVQALSRSASTPLRNRITIGGSVAAFPAWSDLAGPLLALDTTVHLAGDNVVDVPLTTYLTDADVRRQALITGVSFPGRTWRAAYFRWTRTEVDVPAFTLTVLLDVADTTVREARAVAVGTRDRFTIMTDLVQAVTGQPLAGLAHLDISGLPGLEIPNRRHGSAEYLSRMAHVELERMLKRLAGGDA